MSVTAALAITGAIAAAASTGGGIIKTRRARQQQRKLQQQLDAQKEENQAWYNRRYYEDATQRADNQRLLTQARRTLLNSSKGLAGQSRVQGLSNAAVAAQKEAANESYAGIVSGVAANAAAQKDNIEASYRQRQQQLGTQQMQADQQRYDNNMAAIDTAVQGINTAAQAVYSASTANQPTNATDAGTNTGGDAAQNTDNASADQMAQAAAPEQNGTQQYGKEYNQKRLSGLLGFNNQVQA